MLKHFGSSDVTTKLLLNLKVHLRIKLSAKSATFRESCAPTTGSDKINR